MEFTFPDGVTVHVHDAIVLARKSQKAKGRAETSIESQDEDAREWAEEQGLSIVATVADVASGKKAVWERKNAKPWVTQPDLMVKYQAIVAAKMDRWTRGDWWRETDLRRWAEENHKALLLVEKDLRWPPRQGTHYDDDVAAWNHEAEAANREWNMTSRRYKRSQRQLISENHAVGRPIYGYRLMGINCQETPCRCSERDLDDNKRLVIWKPEAKVIREIVTRYLGGESLQAIIDDLHARNIPSPKYGKSSDRWHVSSLARLLRNPGLAGRRQNAEGKTVHRCEGIITWQTHLELVARLDSRAHRKGISPANSYMLTGIITDEAGHAMYGMPCGGGNKRAFYYFCRRRGCAMISVKLADEIVTQAVLDVYGDDPHMVKRIIPGKNHFDDIARLRQDRDEIQADMDKAMDNGQDPAPYLARYTEINAEIRRLTKLDQEHPEPDRIGWVKSGKTVAQHWQSLDAAGRRDWLCENGWTVTATKDDELPDGFRLAIDAGWTGHHSSEQALEALGIPVSDQRQAIIELPSV